MTAPMTSTRDWLTYIKMESVGAPDSELIKHIVDSATEFCKLTDIWKEELSAIDIVAATATYDLPVGPKAAVQEIFEADYNGNPLRMAVETSLRGMLGAGWRTKTATTPEWYYAPFRGRIRLVPIPSAALVGGLFVQVSLKPKAGVNELPAFLFDQYRDGIAAGARARLFRTVNTPFSSPEASQLNYGLFMREVSKAKIDAEKSGLRFDLYAKPVPFGGYEGADAEGYRVNSWFEDVS